MHTYRRNMRIQLLVLMAVMSLSLYGCGGQAVKPESATVETETAAQETAGAASNAEDTTGTAATEETSDAPEATEEPEVVELQILATSDLHGKMMPWAYAADMEEPGSMVQLATAVAEKRTDCSILVDAGDLIQDNSAELFLSAPVHPMVQAINYIGYDVFVPGNHEFDYPIPKLRPVLDTIDAQVLAANIIDSEGQSLAAPYTILERNGLRVGIIGLVTPNIVVWSAEQLQGWDVRNPMDVTKELLAELEGQTDVLIGVCHMSMEEEYDAWGSGVRELAEAYPQFDLIVASHTHICRSEENNGVLCVENAMQADTLWDVRLTFTREGEHWQRTGRDATTIEVADYAQDEGLVQLLAPYHEEALADAHTPIAELQNGSLVDDEDFTGLPRQLTEDTAFVDLIQDVQLYYSGADVSATAYMNGTNYSNIEDGTLSKADVATLYRYNNTLYKVRMTGAQLRKYMEWTAAFYETIQSDGEIRNTTKIPVYNYDMFAGVNYEINLTKPEGERITKLTWPDGSPVADTDSFTLATSNYRCNSLLLAPGVIYEEGDMPELIEKDVHSEIGIIRDLIRTYIVDVKGGTIEPHCDHNWSIITK